MSRFPKVNYIAILLACSLLLVLGAIIYLILDDKFWTFFLVFIICFLLIPFTGIQGIARAGLPVPVGRLVAICKDDRSILHDIPKLDNKKTIPQDQDVKRAKKPFVKILRTITGILFGSSMMSPWIFGTQEQGMILRMPEDWVMPAYLILFSLTAVSFVLLWIAEDNSSSRMT